ncbi:hypothetical protein L1987_63027 [Smallanthus sonchifolius]|uniref:Uncharacterized protein n=1 Tax=Smallanthus sonchifolius TaxID=185202 RepID=A0ACB9CC09_9ASTR|nr:hypothetical protein L1987_63027 [Smallanthus sonchifolius]
MLSSDKQDTVIDKLSSLPRIAIRAIAVLFTLDESMKDAVQLHAIGKEKSENIFSWVHRQFHHKDAKNADNDKVTLLENEAFSSACVGWREGILSIGTLGIDLSQDFKGQDTTFMNNQVLFFHDGNDDNDDDHDEEMECPLVLKASKHGFDHVEKQDLSPCDEVAKPNNHQDDLVKDSTEISKIRERTTLADLFRFDSENNLFKSNELSDDHKIKLPYHDNNNTRTESIKSFILISKMRKKLTKDDLAKPIKKTKQLMTKMLKKKIHPDIGIQEKTALTVCQEMNVHAT